MSASNEKTMCIQSRNSSSWETVCSLNILWTLRRTMIRFLIFSSLNMVRTVETCRRWLADAIRSFGVFVLAFAIRVVTMSTWCSTHKSYGSFDHSMLEKKFRVALADNTDPSSTKADEMKNGVVEHFALRPHGWLGTATEGDKIPPEKTGETVDRRQNNWSIKATTVSTVVLRYTAVTRTMSAALLSRNKLDEKKVQLSQLISTSLLMISPGTLEEKVTLLGTQTITLVSSHYCLKVPMQLPSSAVTGIWSRKQW